jgi:glutathione S-transferase kappa 1
MSVTLFFDVVSPYSRFAFTALKRYRHCCKLDVQLRPVYLGGIMKATGNVPPITVAAKGTYMMQDLRRNAHYFGVETNAPTVFPLNTVKPMRALAALERDSDVDRLWQFSELLFDAYWRDSLDISNDDVIVDVLGGGDADYDVQRLVECTGADEVKKRLIENTEEAVSLGAFGAPWIAVKPSDSEQIECFFGSDRFHLLLPLVGQQWQGPMPQEHSRL